MDIDEDDENNALIIPKPALLPLPSKSPLKSAMASPNRKKSPSPKRVQFVSEVRILNKAITVLFHVMPVSHNPNF